jgi:hypothetical protein
MRLRQALDRALNLFLANHIVIGGTGMIKKQIVVNGIARNLVVDAEETLANGKRSRNPIFL